MIRDVPFHFEIAGRRLWSPRRRLSVRAWSLPQLLLGAAVDLPEPGPDGTMLRSAPAGLLDTLGGAGRLVYVRDRQPRHYASLEGGYDAYLAGFSGKTRSTLRRKQRRFEELSGGAPDIRIYRTPAEIDLFHGLAREVSALTYQEKRLDAGLPTSDAYRAEMRSLAAEGLAWGFLLFLDGRPVAYLYTPVRDGAAIYDYLGYDPTIADHSPGTVLQLAAMAQLFAAPDVRWFDFTEGDGAHKRLFATGRIDVADVALLKATLANRALIAAHRTFNTAVARVSDVAERHGLKTRVKKLLGR